MTQPLIETPPAPLTAAAQALRTARAARRPIRRVSETFDLTTLEQAYAVASLNTDEALRRGRRIRGRKIGLTSPAVQHQLGVNQPDHGVLFDDMEHLSGDTLDSTRLIQPRAEAEVAFVMDSDLADPEVPWGRFLRTIAFALPALEIVDSAIQDWRITLVDTVADNASCGLYVLGLEPRRVSDLALDTLGMQTLLNGQTASVGSGAACLGHPLRAAHWLARTLAGLGHPLRAGDVLLSGALGPMFDVRAGDHVQARLGALGSVDCRFL